MPKYKHTKQSSIKHTQRHIDELYEFYQPAMILAPTADEVLMSGTLPSDNVNFEIKYKLAALVVEELINVHKRYGNSSNVLFRHKEQNFFKFLNCLSFELQIYFLTVTIKQGIKFNLTSPAMDYIYLKR